MTVLVSGGAGYIGSHTVRALQADGLDVVVLDSMELGHAESIGDTPLVVGDIADDTLVRKVVADHGVDAAVHFAGYKAVGESMEQPTRYFENNVGAMATFLGALAASGVARVVFSSSCSVYGTPSVVPVDETCPTDPESVYAQTKLMGEQMLAWFDACHGVRSASLRYFNAAGAAPDGTIGEDSPKPLNLVPLAMLAALGQVPALQVFGTDYPTPDGSAIRDYIHVDDLSDAHVRALRYLESGGDTTAFNLGTGIGSSVLEVIEGTREVSGIDLPVVLAERRAGDAIEVYADNAKARTELGWDPRYALDEILSSAWRWHSTHPAGYATTD